MSIREPRSTPRWPRRTVLGAASAAGAVGAIGAGSPAAGAVSTGAVVGPAVASGSPSRQPPEVSEDADGITVDNGPVRLRVEKESGRARELWFDGRNLLGAGGRGNYDMNTTREGGRQPLPPTENGYRIRTGEDFVDLVHHYSPTDDGPFWLERHHILRSGEPGLHLASVFRHSGELHGFRTDQHRYVFYLNHELFTHAWVGDDPIGERWRDEAARLPSPEELAAAPMVMDATHDLRGVGSAYPRRYYTKYDWAVYLADHDLHGLYGNGVGIWAVLPNREAFCGGPARQDLTLHQTTERPVLLVEPQATHYGSPPLRVRAGQHWERTYGPYYVHLARGEDPDRMRREARAYARFDAHADFYDRLGIPGWVPTDERATVTGRVLLPDGAPRHATAVLADNRQDFQRTVLGTAHWTRPDDAGDFRITHVRPGRYRLTICAEGVWDEFVVDDVEVSPGGTLRLGTLHWQPPRHGRTVFRLGTPNRTSVEFGNGERFRRYGVFERFDQDYPDGVSYVVGRGDPRDWHYVQYQRAGSVVVPDRAIVPTGAMLFDFGASTGPVVDGHLAVTPDLRYDPARGYGLDREVDARDRGSTAGVPDGLHRDFVVGERYAFDVDLPPGGYRVTVISGDQIAANDTRVLIGDSEEQRLRSAAGAYARHTTSTRVTDGRLRCVFDGDGRVNGLWVRPEDRPHALLAGLRVSGWETVPAFSPYRGEYLVDVPPDTEWVTVRPEPVPGAIATVNGRPAGADGVSVRLRSGNASRTEVEVRVRHPDTAASERSETYRLHVVRQQNPATIRFDLDRPAPAGATATLTVWLAAWSLGSAIPVPDEPSQLRITLNGEARTWTFQPDDARGATYRSGCGGRTYRRTFDFDAATLRERDNLLEFRINADSPHLSNEVAYDAIRLDIGGG